MNLNLYKISSYWSENYFNSFWFVLKAMKKNGKIYYFLFCTFAVVFALSNISCDPIEAITDTYGDIVDEVLPDDENTEENVGQVIINVPATGTGNTISTTVTVLNQLGNLIPRIVPVSCTFTDIATSEIITQTSGATTDGIAQCNAVNGGSLGVTVSQVAVSEGVSSQAQFFFIGVT